jgi:uncharacterized iron-regulated protein
MSKTTKLWAWSVGLLLFWASPACAQTVVNPVQSHSADAQLVLNRLVRMDVVYLGETHDRQGDHDAQLEIIRALYRQNPNVAIAMEMFQRPYQTVLDQYLAGEITASQLRQQSQYDQRWGFPWDYYAPILEFAQTHQLPVIALNTPGEITRQVAQSGLESLSLADRQWIPPIDEIHTNHSAYRELLQETYHSHAGHGNSNNFDNFFTAQVLWDETMADGIANFLQDNPDTQVIVLVGQGHLVYGYGIPDRVERRMVDDPNFQQRSILLNPPAEVMANPTAATGEAIADYFWITETEK